MAKDLAGVQGEVTVTFNEQDMVVVRSALRMYIQSKKRAVHASMQDAELYQVFHGQLVRGNVLLQKVGG